MNSGRFDFETTMPVAGNEPAARHASATGAIAAGARLGKRIPKVLEAFAHYRRLTIAKASTLTDIPINSMCSVWNRLDTGDKPHQLGWIKGTGEFEAYTLADGWVVKREIHELTAIMLRFIRVGRMGGQFNELMAYDYARLAGRYANLLIDLAEKGKAA